MRGCWVNYANKRVYGGVLGVYAKRNIDYSRRLIMELFGAFWAKVIT